LQDRNGQNAGDCVVLNGIVERPAFFEEEELGNKQITQRASD